MSRGGMELAESEGSPCEQPSAAGHRAKPAASPMASPRGCSALLGLVPFEERIDEPQHGLSLCGRELLDAPEPSPKSQFGRRVGSLHGRFLLSAHQILERDPKRFGELGEQRRRWRPPLRFVVVDHPMRESHLAAELFLRDAALGPQSASLAPNDSSIDRCGSLLDTMAWI